MKAKAVKPHFQRTLPDDAAKLLELITNEIEAPIDMQELLERLPATANCIEEARALLKAKDRYARRAAFIETERLWFNKYSWFMARIVALYGVIIFLIALATGGAAVNFTIALVLGAAGYYLLLVTLSNVRYRRHNKKRGKLVEREAQTYQREIVQIAARLMRRFNVNADQHPIASPRSSAGLEQRAEGYFIPVDTL